MFIKRSVSFLLHTRKRGDAMSGKGLSIRMRVTYGGFRPLDFPTNLKIDAEMWDKQNEAPNQKYQDRGDQTLAIVLNTLNEYKTYIREIFTRYELLEKRVPDPDEVKQLFNDMAGRVSIAKAVEKLEKEEGLFTVFNMFVRDVGDTNQWENHTYEKFDDLKNILTDFDKDLTFEKLTEKKLLEYLDYLYTTRKNRNSTASKNISFLYWFLRWAAKKGYYKGKLHEEFRPKFKGTDGNSKEVIHLTWDELIHFYNFEFDLPHLAAARDVFCFMAFTGLRHSDVLKLRKSDVKKDHIIVVTKKTVDGIIVELNKYSRAILDRYKKVPFPNGRVLPVISNQKENEYIKEAAKVAGINDLQRVVYFRKKERVEEVHPKWKLLSTHAGRRTFTVNALYLGVPAEVIMKWTGWSDFKSMKPYLKIVDELKKKEMSKFDET